MLLAKVLYSSKSRSVRNNLVATWIFWLLFKIYSSNFRFNWYVILLQKTNMYGIVLIISFFLHFLMAAAECMMYNSLFPFLLFCIFCHQWSEMIHWVALIFPLLPKKCIFISVTQLIKLLLAVLHSPLSWTKFLYNKLGSQ